MGNRLFRIYYRTCIACGSNCDIVGEESLEAVEEIVMALRRNAHVLGHGWVFRAEAGIHDGVVNEIVEAIENGSAGSIRSMLEAGWRFEAAQALYVFLTRIEQPLIPVSIQSLVLDNNNANIPPEMVASDVLGLIKEQLPPTHIRLLALILHLLDCSIKLSPADELRGHTLPVSMLPVFFNIQNHHLMREWRRIITIFVEIIRQASSALNVFQHIS
ncbi:uncharacterized protein LOC132703181 [Cylas formicarius]|uniref:uncharacterized protein LOC132703181 n=1 Tax=Cylas formicarius TaxID=197179 RepID=UPI0029587BC1|nr:uncharacterized protein LOC132703181 [Cylas formicarius]